MAHKLTLSEKIAHFLRLAEDGGATQDERDLASAEAERLMLKHGIDRVTLPTQKVKEELIKRNLFFGGTYAKQRLEGAASVAKALGLACYQMTDVYGEDPVSHKAVKGNDLYIVGYESDVRDALTLLGSLDLQAAVAVQAWAKSQKGAWYWYSAADKQVARRSFLQAFGQGAATRIREQRAKTVQQAEAEHTGTALVLVDRQRAAEAFMRAGTNLRRSRSTGRRYDPAGHAAGRSAGYNASGNSRGIGSGRLALSR